ncbi:MAG: PKD domain-containing protein, partial [Bacteroidales bacterium]|nr:PKD domain-containing protein [Bacteroidales bacterium]
SGKGNYINGMAIMGDNLYFILDETPSGREIYYFNTGDSGAEEPSADFSANSNSINEGQAVSFTDLSTGNPTSWLWDFGDGNTSEEQNPEHTFTSEGIYTISLSAMNNEGSDTEIKNNYITVVSSNSEYQLETSFEPFELIDDLIQLSGDEPWDDPNYVIDIPSEMNALGINVDYIVIADGFVACFNHETNESVYIYVFGNDMIDRGMLENISKSKIGYKIIEQDGQIELIVQWENVGSYYEYLDYGTQNLFVNYQFKYDGKNETYEFNYGSNNITDSINFYSEAPGPYIGLEKYDDEMNIIKPNYFITDSPLSPSFGINDVELSGTPPENISYYIYKEANSIAENFISPNISINPNPSTGNFLLSEDVSLIEVFNSNGKQIISEKSKNSINLMNFPQGVYYAKIKIGGTFIVKKIVKI